MFYHVFRGNETHLVCLRCDTYKPSYNAKPDSIEWVRFKLSDESWEQWRQDNPKEVEKMRALLHIIKL